MAFARYTLLRLLLFLAVAGLFYLLGFRGLVLLLIAVLVSGVLSLFALSRSRDAASESLYNRMQTIRNRLNEQAAAEDEWDEDQRRSGETSDGKQTNSAGNPSSDPAP